MAALQRAVGNEAVQRAMGGGRSPVLDVVGHGGSPLTPDVREDMEARLGADFSDVRVHTDGTATSSAAAVGAHAYTVGHDVVFGAGRFDTRSDAGRTVLAHELTHVIQQRTGPVAGTPTGDGISVSDPSDRFEREAEANAARVMRTPAAQRSRTPEAQPLPDSRHGSVVQRFTDDDVQKKAHELWDARGRPQGEDEGRRRADYLEAKRRLRAYEVWEAKGRPQGQSPEAERADYDTAATEIVEAHRLLEIVKTGGRRLDVELEKQAYAVWEARGRRQGQDTTAQEADHHAGRTAMLDLLERGLSNEEFAYVAACLMLSVPATVVDGEESRLKALQILEVELYDKRIARTLLDEQTFVVVIPRNARMTDVAEFSSLAGTKTFDGRTWEEVRGFGGFRVEGKPGIYVAITEENLTGTDAVDAAAGSDWYYPSGYSTTSHELAHVVDRFGLTTADRQAVDALYQAKRTAEGTGAAVEWIDGFNKYTTLSDDDRYDAYRAIDAGLEPRLNAAGIEADHHAGARSALYESIVRLKPMDSEWGPWLAHAGILTHDSSAVRDASGDRVLELDGTLSNASRKGVLCYAATDRLEYFAQTANAWFGTNTGQDPYTNTAWTAAGEPDRARRRNGRAEVERIEPELARIMARIFGKREIKGAHPRP